ncbi:MAG: hypothetical protein PHU49_00360 [Syntrophorhabdaceae bacterium]|nr:hypothetical protein [Syntrophorhabdaceae bacterium]
MKEDELYLLRQSTLYARHTEYEAMIGQIDNYTKLSGLPIRLALFTSSVDPSRFFCDVSSSEYKIVTKYSAVNVFIGDLHRQYGRKQRHSISGDFVLFRHDKYNVYFLLTDEGTTFFEEGILKYVRSRYPRLTLPFFYSWEIEMMLNRLAKTRPESRIMLTKISKKSRLIAGESRKEKETELTWTDLFYRDVFRQVKQTDTWIEKVYFDLMTEARPGVSKFGSKTMSGLVSRDGVFKVESGFRLLYDTVLDQAIEIFSRRTEQLSNRARTKDTQFKPKPLFIEFDEPVFHDKEQNRRLIEVIKHLSNSARSVIHDNPYLHVSVIDYMDNSNYEVWVLSDSRISIVPQTICTMHSLNRFCDHISKEFQEGMVKDSREMGN